MTGNYGEVQLSTPTTDLPEFFKISINPGGINIATGEETTTKLTSISSSKSKALSSTDVLSKY